MSIRVLIVEDSNVVREFLQQIIDQDPRLEVAAAVESAEKALRLLPELRPDVISMDIRLPGMNGFEATQQIMTEQPTPIVVISASVESEDLKITMNALKAGALSVVEKPVGTSHEDYQAMTERICTQLAIMSQVKVVRQRTERSEPIVAEKVRPEMEPSTRGVRAPGAFEMLGIVTSTGGPNALVEILNDLPRELPLPILLVQHISSGFMEGFVSWLDSMTPFSVQIGQNGEVPNAGCIYVAPSDHHLKLQEGRMWTTRDEPVCAQRPSGTVLFRSMANELGGRAIGVLLTGMGEDGAEGLLQLRKAGAYTLAEDESTAVVYGMPNAAHRLAAVCEMVPLHRIGRRISGLVLENQESVR